MGNNRSHETNQNAVTPSEIPVPVWEKVYAFSVAVLNSADGKQLAFYEYFKQRFLNGKIIDVEGNTNYVFALMFDLIDEFRTHRDEELIVQQLTMLETAYPVIQRYTENNLAEAIEGKPKKRDPSAGIELSIDVGDMFDDLKRERPDLFEAEVDEADESESEDDLDDYFVEDDADGTETLGFPPSDPIYTVTLAEKLDSGYNCLETNISLNSRPLANLKARLISLRADLNADRLFVQTMYAENEDSFSIFCFELSTGKQLWQTKDIPPGGSLFIDCEKLRIEAGLTYGIEECHIVVLDYDGNLLQRNFKDGYAMIAAADKLFLNGKFDEARDLFVHALDTKISINTKITAAKTLVRICRVTGDEALSQSCSEQLAEFEAEKKSKKMRAADKSARQQVSLSERLASRRNDLEEPAQPVEASADASTYWNKRSRQSKEIGGK